MKTAAASFESLMHDHKRGALPYFGNVEFQSGVDVDIRMFKLSQGVIECGVPDGWRIVAVRFDDGLRFRAGCRWFTVEEAERHWRQRWDRKRTRLAIAYGIAMAKAMKWPIGKRLKPKKKTAPRKKRRAA